MSVRTTYFFLLLFLLTPVFTATSAGLDDADARLFKAQLAMAEKGDMRAQYYLGEMHEQGLGTRPDVDEAFKWYAKAAEQGDPLAKRKLTHRQEIIGEMKSRSTPMADVPNDQAGKETDRTEVAEREKRRATVRAMILERMRHPVGAPFGE